MISKSILLTLLVIISAWIVVMTTGASGFTGIDPLKRPKIGDLRAKADIVQEIKDANKASNWQEAEKAISPALALMRINEKDCYVVKYSDKEIQDAIVDLYLRVNERKPDDPWFEPGESGDFLDVLRTMAESTFSPEIYGMELYSGKLLTTGRLKVEYLSNVNPSQTLSAILASVTKRKDYDGLADPSGRFMQMDIIDAMKILYLLSIDQPEMIDSKKDEIKKFVGKIIPFYHGNPRMLQRDLDARSNALDVLGKIAEPQDASLIRQISEDSLANKQKDAMAKDLIRKGAGILKTRFGIGDATTETTKPAK